MGKLVNLVGRVFHDLTVIERIGSNKQNRPVWKCLCSCGLTCEAVSIHLVRNETRHCGCKGLPIQKTRIDHNGKKFGSWTVISEDTSRPRKPRYLICECVCGLIKSVSAEDVTRGKSRGCMKCVVHDTKHGHSRRNHVTREYHSYSAILERCLNSNNPSYKNYGGRGITVCERWLESFDNFWEDMGKRPPKMSIGRIDNDGNYCKDNCRWETDAQQARNTRNSVKITYKGETKNLIDWMMLLGYVNGSSKVFYETKKARNCSDVEALEYVIKLRVQKNQALPEIEKYLY